MPQDLRGLIAQMARKRGLDPRAVLAVAAQEGLGGGIGDQGTSYGPFQLHKGGAYPSSAPQNAQAAQAWASSQQGLAYALDQIAKVAGGKQGAGAVRSIVSQFERPADPGSEIAKALAAYGNGAGRVATSLSSGAGTVGQNPGLPSGSHPQFAQALLAQVGKANPDYSGVLGAIKQEHAGAPSAPNLSGALAGAPGGAPGVVKNAESYLGVPYQYGGSTRKGIDCSALLQNVWSQAGVKIPRTTYDQWKVGTPVATPQLRPGDAVFFRGSDAHGNLPGHVGIYIGGGKFIESPHTGASVRVSTLAGRSDYVGARHYGGKR